MGSHNSRLGRTALAGAAIVVAASAATAAPAVRIPQTSVHEYGHAKVWLDGRDVWVQELGRDPVKVPLGDTPESQRLRAMLVEPADVKGRMILVGGGGNATAGEWHPASKKKPKRKST